MVIISSSRILTLSNTFGARKFLPLLISSCPLQCEQHSVGPQDTKPVDVLNIQQKILLLAIIIKMVYKRFALFLIKTS